MIPTGVHFEVTMLRVERVVAQLHVAHENKGESVAKKTYIILHIEAHVSGLHHYKNLNHIADHGDSRPIAGLGI